MERKRKKQNRRKTDGYLDTRTSREINRWTEKQMEKQSDRQTNKQTCMIATEIHRTT
jgi:hypothetical protein